MCNGALRHVRNVSWCGDFEDNLIRIENLCRGYLYIYYIKVWGISDADKQNKGTLTPEGEKQVAILFFVISKHFAMAFGLSYCIHYSLSLVPLVYIVASFLFGVSYLPAHVYLIVSALILGLNTGTGKPAVFPKRVARVRVR